MKPFTARTAPTDWRRAGEILWCIDDLRYEDADYDAVHQWVVGGVGVAGGLRALGHAGALEAAVGTRKKLAEAAASAPFSAHWRALGRVIAMASDADYAEATTIAHEWRDGADELLRASIDMIFPSEPWATEDARADKHGTYMSRGMLLLSNRDAAAAERIVARCQGTWDTPVVIPYAAHALAYRFGKDAEPWLVAGYKHAGHDEWRGEPRTWAQERIVDALAYISADRVRELTRPTKIKGASRVKVKGDFRLVGNLAAWSGPSRSAIEELGARVHKRGEKLTVNVNRKSVTVRGTLRGDTFLYDGKTLAGVFALPKDAGVVLVGEITFLESQSGIGLRAANDATGSQIVEPLGPGAR